MEINGGSRHHHHNQPLPPPPPSQHPQQQQQPALSQHLANGNGREHWTKLPESQNGHDPHQVSTWIQDFTFASPRETFKTYTFFADLAKSNTESQRSQLTEPLKTKFIVEKSTESFKSSATRLRLYQTNKWFVAYWRPTTDNNVNWDKWWTHGSCIGGASIW